MWTSTFLYLQAGDVVRLEPELLRRTGEPREGTAAALAELREFYGDAIDRALAGPWMFVERVSAAGNPAPAGKSARIRCADGFDIVVHHRDLTTEEPTPASSLAPAASPGGRAPLRVVDGAGPVRQDRVPPWKDNRKVGGVFVEAEPGGTLRVSLSFVEGGQWRAQARAAGLRAYEVSDAVSLFAGRLAARAADEAGRDAAGRKGW